MQDIKMSQDNLGNFDISIDFTKKRINTVNGFETALDFQVFVDKRATENEIGNPRFRQGWIGDLYTKENNYEVGSYCFLKQQSRNTVNDQNELIAYIEDSLDYFVTNGMIKGYKVSIENNYITAIVNIDNSITMKYSRLWSNTNGS